MKMMFLLSDDTRSHTVFKHSGGPTGCLYEASGGHEMQQSGG